METKINKELEKVFKSFDDKCCVDSIFVLDFGIEDIMEYQEVSE